jgi:hypothetical protein
LTGVDPQTYFGDVLTRLVNLWPASRLDELIGPGQRNVPSKSSRRDTAAAKKMSMVEFIFSAFHDSAVNVSDDCTVYFRYSDYGV